MRLLILTQKVDKEDPILGFFHRWIEEFAKHAESVIVICLEEGKHDLPANVRVLSLGKERGASKLGYIKNFYKFIWQERRRYDSVFVHMNPEYVILGGVFWRIIDKKVGLWYVHRAVNFRIWFAEKFVHYIFTSAPESFKLKSSKIHYLGHGIDADIFRFIPKDFNKPVSLLHAGRITRIKDIYDIIEGTEGWPLTLVGEPVTADDKKYQAELKELANELERDVRWAGAIPNYKMPEIYEAHTASINASPDGGMDKSVLESLASGCPVLVRNKAFQSVFGEYFPVFNFKDAPDLPLKLSEFLSRPDKKEIAGILSKKVHSEYSVSAVIGKIIRKLDVQASR